jgi:hypothetical protein
MLDLGLAVGAIDGIPNGLPGVQTPGPIAIRAWLRVKSRASGRHTSAASMAPVFYSILEELEEDRRRLHSPGSGQLPDHLD